MLGPDRDDGFGSCATRSRTDCALRPVGFDGEAGLNALDCGRDPDLATAPDTPADRPAPFVPELCPPVFRPLAPATEGEEPICAWAPGSPLAGPGPAPTCGGWPDEQAASNSEARHPAVASRQPDRLRWPRAGTLRLSTSAGCGCDLVDSLGP